MLLEIVNKATLPNLNVKFNSSVLVLSFYEIKNTFLKKMYAKTFWNIIKTQSSQELCLSRYDTITKNYLLP